MNMAIAINACCDFMRNDLIRVQIFRKAQHLYMPLIVL